MPTKCPADDIRSKYRRGLDSGLGGPFNGVARYQPADEHLWNPTLNMKARLKSGGFPFK